MKQSHAIIYAFLLGLSIGWSGCRDAPQPLTKEAAPVPATNDTFRRQATADPAAALARVTNQALDSIQLQSYSGNADRDFVQIMLWHQKAALEMFRVVGAQGQNEELKELAGKIAEKVQQEHAFLQTVSFETHGPDTSDFSAQAVHLLDSLTRQGLSMHGAYLDLDFATMMIQHHFLAMELARLYKSKGRQALLLSFAQRIRGSYQRDTEALESWKRRNYPNAH